jgi:isopenicillin N synthase-like dioxygenase
MKATPLYWLMRGPAVTNHGIPAELTADHFEMQRRFFSMPLEKKMTIAADANNRQAWRRRSVGLVIL